MTPPSPAALGTDAIEAATSSLPSDPSQNQIAAAQNSTASLDLLAARYDRYAWAHRILMSQVAFVVALPVLLSIAQTAVPSLQRWAAAYGTLALCLDLWLNRQQDRFREEGARIQEKFDRSLFQLPWPTSTLGAAPAQADIALWADQGRAKASAEEQARWLDWYPRVFGQLPLSVARVACQRANGWWDAGQRRTYALWLRIGGWVIPIMVTVYALIDDMRVGAVANTLLALAPLMAWCWQEAGRHTDVADGRRRVMDRAQAAFERGCVGAAEEELRPEAADLQRDIFEQRRKAPMLPWFVYRCIRGDYEPAMQRCAEDDVVAFHSRGAKPTSLLADNQALHDGSQPGEQTLHSGPALGTP